MDKPVILMLLQGLKLGGLENVTFNLSKNILLQEDFNIEICCYDSCDDQYSAELKILGIPLHYLPRGKGIDWSYPLKLSKLIRTRGIDIIHAHNFTAWFYSCLSTLFANLKVVYTEHDNSFLGTRCLNLICRFCEARTSYIFTVSDNVKKTLNHFHFRKPIGVIYNGVDDAFFKIMHNADREQKKKEVGINGNGLIMVVVGRMDAMKNQRILIDILPDILKDFPDSLLLFVGDGVLRKDLEAQVKNADLHNNVIFLGNRNDVHSILGISDIFLLPSLTEGLPVSVIEAMATSIPVVVSNVGGVPELITDGREGFLINPQDKNELVWRIKQLIGDKLLRLKMGNAGYKKFKEKFTVDYMYSSYANVYRNCLKKCVG